MYFAANDGVGHSQIDLREQLCSLQKAEMMLFGKSSRNGIPEKRVLSLIRCRVLLEPLPISLISLKSAVY